jgi:UDP-glucose 4-epimerase
MAKIERWMSRNPLTSRFVSLDETPENNHAVILPVQEAILGSESVVLPYPLLDPLIRQASGHFILEKCPCRNAENCSQHPHDFGCLFLGKSVNQISPLIGSHMDVFGALAHLEHGLRQGLVPMIVHASFDAKMLSLPYNKMLAVCFCCDCCCTIRHHLRLGPSSFDDTILRLPGFTVTISEQCDGCGSCHSVCPVNAISEIDGKSVIDQIKCKGCGLCSAVCPARAPKLHLDPEVNVLEILFARIRDRTDIGI